jgi:hypothetical protein
MHSGEQTRMLSRAAGSILARQTSLKMTQTTEGYELISGEEAPVHCTSWPQARRVLARLGVPEHKIDEISSRLAVGIEIVVRRRA